MNYFPPDGCFITTSIRNGPNRLMTRELYDPRGNRQEGYERASQASCIVNPPVGIILLVNAEMQFEKGRELVRASQERPTDVPSLRLCVRR